MPSRTVNARVFDRALVVVGVLGVLVRLLYVLEGGRDPSFYHPIIDAAKYHEFARLIALGIDPWHGAFTRPPLHIYMLAGIYWLFGPSMVAARVIQALLGGGTCVITVLLGRQLFDRRAGLIAGLIVAFYGPLVFFDERLQATSLEVFCFMLALLTAVRAAERPGWLNWLVCGLAIGVAALARPTIALFVPVVMLWILVAAVRARQWALSGGRLVALLVGCAAAISPVTIRNYLAGGEFVPISSLGGVNLYLGNNPDAMRTIAIRPGPEWTRLQRLPYADGMTSRSEAERYFLRRVTSYAWNQPGDFLAGLARKARLFCSSIEVPRNYDLYLHRQMSIVLQLLVWRVGPFGFPLGIVAPLAVTGMVLAWRGRSTRLLAIGYALACSIAVILFFNASRYRVPMVPALAVFAGYTLVWLWEQLTTRRFARFGAGLGGALTVGVIVSLPVKTPYDGINFAADLYMCVGGRLIEERDYAGAEQAYRTALEITPDSAVLHDALSYALRRQERRAEALQQARVAVELDPEFAEARVTLGSALAELGQLDEADGHLRRAIELEPSHPRAHGELAGNLARRKDFAGALEQYREAVRFETDNPVYHMGLAGVLIVEQRYRETLDALERATKVAPSVMVTDGLAWTLATCPDATLRDCERAIVLAQGTINGAAAPSPIYLDTLAAAYACAGRFEDAVRAVEQAVNLARATGQERLAEVIELRADLYHLGEPCRDPIRSPDALTAW